MPESKAMAVDYDFNDKSILITGGSGSFGKHSVKSILTRFRPRRLIVYSRDELKQFEMAQEFSDREYDCMRDFIADVRDKDRLLIAMKDVDIVTHAAALKQVILAGRRIDDGMGKFIAEKTVKLMIQAGINIKGAKVNVLGLTFKENCPDLRNSKVPDIIRELESYGIEVAVHDPLADPEEAVHEYGLALLSWGELPVEADAVILAVAHEGFCKMPMEQLLSSLKQPNGVVVDVKACLPVSAVRNPFWRL